MCFNINFKCALILILNACYYNIIMLLNQKIKINYETGDMSFT